MLALGIILYKQVASRIHDKHGDVLLVRQASARLFQWHIFLGAVSVASRDQQKQSSPDQVRRKANLEVPRSICG